jgi:hypothetical protein
MADVFETLRWRIVTCKILIDLQGEMFMLIFSIFFWAEPKEQVCAVFMVQAPSPTRAYYRRFMKDMVSQALID